MPRGKGNAQKKKSRRTGSRRASASKRQLLPGTNNNRTCCLSPISQQYLQALLDPIRGPLVGIPDGSAVLTKKYRCWARGVMTTGTTIKDLAILVNPFGLLTNTQNVIGWQEPATANTLPGTMNTTNAKTANSPFNLTSMSAAGSTLSARLVSCQVRLRYAGTELNQGGTIVGLQEPSHTGLQAKTVDDLLAHTSCKRESVLSLNGRWFTLEYKPADVYDTWFINGVKAATGTNAYNAEYTADGVSMAWDAYPFMAAYITSPVASQPWEYEVWGICEYAGPTVQGRTPNPPDVVGFHTVVAAIAQQDDMMTGNSYQQGPWEQNPKSTSAPPGKAWYRWGADESAQSGQNVIGSVMDTASNLLKRSLPTIADMGAAAARRYGPSLAAAAMQRLRVGGQGMPRIEYID